MADGTRKGKRRVRFRPNITLVILGVVMLFAAVTLAANAWYLLPVLLVPLGLIAWALRGGTEVDETGVRVRALLGSRHLSWTEIDGFTPRDGRVLAVLATGRVIPLPGVRPADVPLLLRAGGQPSDLATAPTEPDDETDSDS